MTDLSKLAASLTEAQDLLLRAVEIITHCEVTEGVCCCGDSMDNHPSPMVCGHSPVDHGSYVATGWLDAARAYLKGQSDAEA